MKIKSLIIATAFILLTGVSTAGPVLAQTGVTTKQTGGSYDFSQNSGLDKASAQAGYNSNDETRDLSYYISNVITFIISLLGTIFLGFTIYGGIIWMTAQGNEEKVKKARDLITESLIGLIIVLAAYAISFFVLKMTGGSLLS